MDVVLGALVTKDFPQNFSNAQDDKNYFQVELTA